MKKYVVGLRGGIGTGKSTVSAIFESFGVDIADADISSRNIMQPGKTAFEKVIRHFGKQVLDNDGMIDRAKLRTIIFSDPEAKIFLEKNTVFAIIEDLTTAIRNSESEYVLLVLSTGAGKTDMMNRLLVVDSPIEHQISRVMKRDRHTRKEVEAIIAAQPSRKERLKDLDDLIVNDGAIERITDQVSELHETYLKYASRA
ncbi:MAG: dephospho-CoA kinase [Gammaproteobacteria bacterium]|nr:dephospho-CoA kinase [Gammaproteobacteria bacterium]